MFNFISFFSDVWDIVTEHGDLLLKGVGNTMLIAVIGTVAGLAIGLMVGILRTTPFSKNRVLRVIHKFFNALCAVYIEVFRGTPMMVQAMVIYWGYAFASGGNTLPLIPSGIVIVSINTGAYMSEIVRGGIISIDKGQLEGAQAIGMTHLQAMIYVIIPQAIRNILPSISNEFIINIKDTSVLNVIGVAELYFYAGKIQLLNLQIFQTYFVICVIYFVLTFSISNLLRFLEKKLDGNENYTICGSQTDFKSQINIPSKED